MQKQSILILCIGNSARSQMAEGLMRHAAGDRFEIHSAGTIPSFVRPEAITVMAELGIDISGHRSKSVDEFTTRPFRYVITVCDNAKAACPIFSGDSSGEMERLHWPFEDPAAVEGTEETRLAAFRKIRDQIQSRISNFFKASST